MMLNEDTPVADAALPLQGFKDHLRLGSAFGDEDLQDGILAGHLRAALGVIEARTGKALLSRRFKLRLSRWRWARSGAGQSLPLAPVGQIISVKLVSAAGDAVTLDPERYGLMQDMARPRLVARGSGLPDVAEGGAVEICFEAGFGATWSALPADLAQAVLMLAAEFYENRQAGAVMQALPLSVHGLIEPWRTVRLLGGAP